MTDRRREFLWGVRDTVPLMLGAFPFGMIYGALAVTAGLSAGAALAMSALVFAGSAQFIAVGLVSAGAPGWVVVATTLVVNLRHLLYSATLLPRLKHLPQRWRIPLAFWLTDETFAVTVLHYRRADLSPRAHWYQLGSSVAMYLNWQFWTLAGVLLGGRIPNAADWGLDVAMPVTFIGMLVPFVRGKPMGACVLAAGIASLLTLGLPYKLGIMAAAFIGIAAGMAAERLVSARSRLEAS